MNDESGGMKGGWCAFQIGRYAYKARHKAMVKGIAACDGVCLSVYNPTPEKVREVVESHNVLFAFTSGMHRTEMRHRAMLESLGVPLLVMDLGYFKRAKGARDETGYNQIGIGKIGWMPPVECADDRWKALGIADALPPISETRPDNRTVLVLGQCANDSQHHLKAAELHAWFAEQTSPMKAHGWRIVYRPHPMERAPEPVATWAHETRTNAQQSLADALATCGHVVTYNSTAGLDAILAGIHVACHESAHYAKIARYGKGQKYVTHAEVMRYMHQVAYAQWTCAEIEQGLPLRFLANFMAK